MGFPTRFISKVRCTHDGSTLEPSSACQLDESDGSIRYGSLHCTVCGVPFAIDDGVLNMLTNGALDSESLREQKIRDSEAAQLTAMELLDWQHNDHEMMEILPTVESLQLTPESTVLELGCGDGRITIHIADRCESILAVDFSMECLRVLRARLPKASHLGLVLGDVTTLQVSSEFDRVLAWPVSNLPTHGHRSAMYRLSASAIRPDGRAVFSMHHFGLWQRLKGVQQSGRYSDNGIYRYIFTVAECKAEIRPHFRVVDVQPVQIYAPFARRLGLPLLWLSRLLERVPLVNRMGALAVCTARHPMRSAS